jgi:hypothetical protein
MALLRRRRDEPWSVLPALLFFNGLCVLGVNVLLTGTADRYMFLGYPFLLAGAVALRQQRMVFGRALVALCFGAACAGGAFVFSRIGPMPGIFAVFRSHELIAAIHLAVLLVLAVAWTRVCRLSTGRFRS